MALDSFHTRLDLIVPRLLARLVEVTGLPPESVFCCQRPKVPYNSQADQYVFMRIEDGSFDIPNFQGAGRIDTRELITFSVTCRTRLSLDEADRDTIFLIHESETSASLGHLLLRHKAHDAMICFQPLDADGSWLVTQPIVPSRTFKPTKPDPVNPEWGESTLAYELIYEMDLNQDYQ